MINKNNFQAFRCLLLGRSGVGKTYNGLKWALSLVKQKVFHPKRVVLISMTFKSDPSQKELVDYCQSKYKGFTEFNCFEDIKLDLLEKLFEAQKTIKEKEPNKLKNWLVIFDDQISSNLIKKQDKNPELKKLFCVGRHYNISQIWMLQRFKATLDPTCRDQFTMIAVFKQGNKKALLELLSDYDETPDIDHKKTLQDLYNYYIDAVQQDDGHGCFVINVLTDYGKGRLQNGLGGKQYYDV